MKKNLRLKMKKQFEFTVIDRTKYTFEVEVESDEAFDGLMDDFDEKMDGLTNADDVRIWLSRKHIDFESDSGCYEGSEIE